MLYYVIPLAEGSNIIYSVSHQIYCTVVSMSCQPRLWKSHCIVNTHKQSYLKQKHSQSQVSLYFVTAAFINDLNVQYVKPEKKWYKCSKVS